MQKSQQETINHVLVTLFNDILRIEEKELRTPDFHDLSVREFHVIEAIRKSGENNTMSALAAVLHITIGSLTVAVNTLCKKGYVERTRSTKDKRVVHITLTDKGIAVDEHHKEFHKEMTQAVIDYLPEDELQILIKALDSIDHYFESKEKQQV